MANTVRPRRARPDHPEIPEAPRQWGAALASATIHRWLRGLDAREEGEGLEVGRAGEEVEEAVEMGNDINCNFEETS